MTMHQNVETGMCDVGCCLQRAGAGYSILSCAFSATPSCLCSIYDERQQLNNEVLSLLTNNTAAMEKTDDLWRQQPYVTPHSRANIVYADKQLQPPTERPGSIRSAQLSFSLCDHVPTCMYSNCLCFASLSVCLPAWPSVCLQV